jgi:phosphate transport system permease protein
MTADTRTTTVAEPSAGLVAEPSATTVAEPPAGMVAEPPAGMVAEPPAGATDEVTSRPGVRPGGRSGTDGLPPDEPGGHGSGGSPPPRPLSAWWRAERAMPHALRAVACLPLAALVLILGILVWKAMPAIRYNGFGFLSRSTWSLGNLYAPNVTSHGISHPVGAAYGAWPLIVGTLQSSVIALILAVPVGIGTALIVVEKLPPRLSSGIGFCLEVLAGIPSVVYGLWAALTLGPFLARDIAQPVANVMPNVPVLDFLRGEGPHNSAGSGDGLLTSGVVLAIMILPIIAATTRDLLRQVPRATVEGAVALGMTDAEATRAVTMPWVGAGIIGASVLGLGRALGETIAVAMVVGGSPGYVTHSLYGAMTTIAATIVSQLDSALNDVSGLAVSALAELGLVLLVITLIANVGARLLVRRVATTVLPVGRGV